MDDARKIELGQAMLDIIQEYDPEMLFGFDRLAEWAIKNGFTEPEPEPFTLEAEFDRELIKK